MLSTCARALWSGDAPCQCGINGNTPSLTLLAETSLFSPSTAVQSHRTHSWGSKTRAMRRPRTRAIVWLHLMAVLAGTGDAGIWQKRPSRWPLRPRPGLFTRPPTTTVAPLLGEDYEDLVPAEGGEVPEDTKYQITVGTCLLHLYEPCYNSKLLLYLLRREPPHEPVLLNTTDPDLLSASGLDTRHVTKLLIHGYNGSLFYEPTYSIATEYLKMGGVNVLVLDWGKYANLPCYPSAVINTWQAGKCTAQALYNLASWTGKPGRFLHRLHIIGFSLGAHIAGFASSYLRPARVGRITGLDPALPFFASLSRSWKLDANDARFVDVIHTNVGLLGKIDHTGHVDFYVNGGSYQPACNSSRHLCSHLMAAKYFAESISAEAPGFWGTQCHSYIYYLVGWCDTQEVTRSAVIMGEKCPKETRGVYFVVTRSTPPFGLGPITMAVAAVEAEEPTESTTVGWDTTTLSAEEAENEELFGNATFEIIKANQGNTLP